MVALVTGMPVIAERDEPEAHKGLSSLAATTVSALKFVGQPTPTNMTVSETPPTGVEHVFALNAPPRGSDVMFTMTKASPP